MTATAGNVKGEKEYSDAFYRNAKEILYLMSKSNNSSAADETSMANASSTAEKYRQCHMVAMKLYSDDLQQIAYKVVLQGGSFADAKMAFDTALATVGTAGGEEFEKLQIMYGRATEAAQECIGNI